MKRTIRHPALLLLAGTLLWSCSDDGPKASAGDGGLDGGPVADGPRGTKSAGAACGGDGDCQSGVCYGGTCALGCAVPADCATGQECTSDDGVRLFCHAPAYPAGIGQSCAVSGVCPTGTSCVGGVSWAHAYCSAACQTDVDCPPTYRCSGDAGQRRCIRRLFCSRCYHDASCGAGKLCIKQGGQTACSRPCTAGSTECPRFAECRDVGGGKHACVHKSGACDGDGSLCEPCHNSECASPGLCLLNTFTQERFCGQDCSSASCPSGYDCVSVGPPDQQCVPHYDSQLKQMAGCVTVSPIGEEGDVVEDFATVGYLDSDDDGSLGGEKLRILRLSDLAGKAKIILFNLSAGWCGPCKQETQHLASLRASYGPKGLAIFQVLFDADSPGEPPTVQLLDAWIKAYNAQGAVGIDVDAESIVYNTTGVTPVNMILDAKTLKVLDKSYGYSQTDLEAKIKSKLGLP